MKLEYPISPYLRGKLARLGAGALLKWRPVYIFQIGAQYSQFARCNQGSFAGTATIG